MDRPSSTHWTPIEALPTQLARRVPSFLRSVAALGLTVFLAGCSLFGWGEEVVAPDPRTPAERIQALRQAIADDHANLEDLITQPREDGTPELHLNPELRTIANRLGENERELARLQTLEREDAR